VDEESAEARLSRSEARAAVVQALQLLRPADREALALLADELPAAEVARVLGVTTNALYVRQSRARSRLLEVIRERFPELLPTDGGDP
jgi:DNA-directed RNA polymerase specialized sigma24 family protein